ncbi:MAG: hypothetical protein IH955_03360 [Chloroflexi bacterium]|nr:hypothetical protein [Chloroflexota bacterium]
MVIVMYSYDILPNKRDQFIQWVQSTGLPFWKAQPEVKSIRVLENFFIGAGSPQRTVLIKVESMADFEKVMGRDEAKKVGSEFHALTTHVKVQYFNLLYAQG